jgi:hypothetical protein
MFLGFGRDSIEGRLVLLDRLLLRAARQNLQPHDRARGHSDTWISESAAATGGSRYGTVVDHAEVSPDSKPSAKISNPTLTW